MKILHLTLKKKWFDLIASGKKTVEYREIKPYWTKRLFVKHLPYVLSPIIFNEIHFRNGYNPRNPFMRVEHENTRKECFNSEIHYGLVLGKILEIKNWVKP